MSKENNRISAEIEPEIREKLVAFAKKETEGKLSPAIRRILREFLNEEKQRG